ncbi:unnamed protein product [Fusarium equiseti]|uniref:Heterokaryon incompatibility domain-containing protein n=1 Tax=Fusarium equiseti TaxID=61235 RepID=A0A8J2NCL1_FUSEQ|nr:unnamed protein product [Fusarium equiseti]
MSSYKTPDWVSSCDICQAIWQRLTSDDKFEHTISLGSFEEALSTKCPHHKPLIEAFLEYTKNGEEENDKSREVRVEFPSCGSIVRLDETVDHYGNAWSLALVDKGSEYGTVRVLDPEWADLSVIKKWKNECLSSHGTSCSNPLRIWRARPAWLIDVQRKCLVPGTVKGDYVALSYTYGGHIGRLIGPSVLERLQVPEALDTPALSEYVSPIIRNAIHLTTVIGERYLWADALCVTHGNDESTTKQLSLMGAIYANAILTVVAADGDSKTGLPGIKGISAPRELKQILVPFGDQQLLHKDYMGFIAEAWLPYYERGWIYQELRLSPRKLAFHEEQLHWQCQRSVWHEEAASRSWLEKDPFTTGTVDSSLRILLAGFFDCSVFSLLVSRYNDMELRYGEDALPAISGFLSVLSRRFQGGFLYGIPEMMFERGLGWKPFLPRTNLERRVHSSRPQSVQLKPSGLPSWSWIGWMGDIEPAGPEATLMMPPGEDEGIEETTSITEWYTSHSPADPPSKWRRIRSTWYENRDTYKDFTRPLPPGWTRHDAPEKSPWDDGPYLFPDGCDKFIFKHKDMPEMGYEPVQGWFYPFPITPVDETTVPDMPEQTEYLFCKTHKAQLWGCQKEGEGKDARLYNSQRQEVGFLNLVNEGFFARFPRTLSEEEKGLPVDLVAVCKIRTYYRTQDEVTKIWSPRQTKDTYLVLWVEWKDGVATRLASGQVDVEKWDELDLESIDLILG